MLLTYKLRMKVNRFVQLMKQKFLGYLLIILFLGKHILNRLSLTKLSLQCYAVSQTIYINKYSENASGSFALTFPLITNLHFRSCCIYNITT